MLAVHPRFHLLKKRFLDGLPARIATISSLLTRAHRGCFNPQTIEDLGRHVHTLTGTAGTYGFHDLSCVAAELEAAVNDGVDGSNLLYLEIILADLRAIAGLYSDPSDLPAAEGF